GIDPRRTLPAFARKTFRSWFARHKPREDGQRILLWPDTFTNHFQPEIGIAAVRVLERAGYRIEIPRDGLCCGRPLYDAGMLGLARRQLQEIEDEIEKGIPIVGLEPSCIAVFRDEGGGRLPVLTLAEFLGTTFEIPPVLVQPHCHHHAVLGLESDRRLLGPDARFLEGCCGMAGGFGFRHYDVSMACAERALLPAIREASPGTVVLADGFSCREQIAQATGRRALHLAELLDYSDRP
ncbi:MAG TPA: heterodisulfide reductase-related iron-sulfur binding cluster, partial [Thermoanaerobaculia bacterium]|nr:heterodisulfide reductase-related iron-sulfur binding cluster [Thermoanaerobaculia bacterium]